MTPAIWGDLRTRMRNLRADMIGQWQGDIDNASLEHAIVLLGQVVQTWEGANPQPTQQAPISNVQNPT